MEENDYNICMEIVHKMFWLNYLYNISQKFLKFKNLIFQKFLNYIFLSDPIQTNMDFSMQICLFRCLSEGVGWSAAVNMFSISNKLELSWGSVQAETVRLQFQVWSVWNLAFHLRVTYLLNFLTSKNLCIAA